MSMENVMERLEVEGAVIEYEVHGNGEPVLLLHLGLVADGLARPLLAQPELASRYQLVHYHRRGYMGSTLGHEPLTMDRQTRDVIALLRHLGVRRAHVAGHSSGGGIALQLAIDAPELVHSLVLMEPALAMDPARKADLQRFLLPMMNVYRSGNKREAAQVFCDAVFGPNWQPIIGQAVPGSFEQAVKDLDTFIKELSAFQEWQFGSTEAAAISQPVLSVLGMRSSPFMTKGRELIHSWFPQTEDFNAQTTHLLELQDPQGVAHGLTEFSHRHPMQ
jgi:pimeloyl-ACP methyl ester carboxylesterase